MRIAGHRYAGPVSLRRPPRTIELELRVTLPCLPSSRRLSSLALFLSLAASQAGAQPALKRLVVRADDGHSLTLWMKRPAVPIGAILLLHGRTWSSRPNFDLQVPGQHLSLMDALVARGYAVYALDQRGYGATPRDSSGWLTPERAASDAAAALDRIARDEQKGPPALLGYSQGSMTALLLAETQPAKTSALILYGFPIDLSVQRTFPDAPAVPPRKHTTAAAAGEDFITPARTLPGVKDEYVREAVFMDSIRVDWRGERTFGALDPAKLQVPTLLLDGERDPYANAANHGAFFPRIATADRWWVVLPGVDHAAHLEAQQAFVNAVDAFLRRNGAKAREGLAPQ
jgi:pimeloyl-ACP methyl ester carboxylesterase